MDGDLTAKVAAWAGSITAAVGAAGGVALLRRRLSRDRTEMTKDRVEGEFVQLLLKERDEALERAQEAWRVRQVDVESIARLTSQNAFQQGEIERLKSEMTSLKRTVTRLYPTTRNFLESDYQEPDLTPIDPTRQKP